MQGGELKSAWSRAFVTVKEDIHTEQQVADFISKSYTDEITLTDLPFRI